MSNDDLNVAALVCYLAGSILFFLGSAMMLYKEMR